MPNFLVFLFKCLNGATDHNVHDFVSFFYFTGGALHGSLCSVYTRPNRSTTVFVCFALSFIVLAVSCIFDCYHILYHFSLLLSYEPYPIKLLKKIKGISVPILSRALFGQLNSLKAGEVIALQITRSLSDNKVSVFTNKSALH